MKPSISWSLYFLLFLIRIRPTNSFADKTLHNLSLADSAFTKFCQKYIFRTLASGGEEGTRNNIFNQLITMKRILDYKPLFANRVRKVQLYIEHRRNAWLFSSSSRNRPPTSRQFADTSGWTSPRHGIRPNRESCTRRQMALAIILFAVWRFSTSAYARTFHYIHFLSALGWKKCALIGCDLQRRATKPTINTQTISIGPRVPSNRSFRLPQVAPRCTACTTLEGLFLTNLHVGPSRWIYY